MTAEVINGVFAIGGAVIGAVLTTLLTRHFQKKTDRRRELTIEVSRPVLLIGVSKEIRSDVAIQVRGKDVNTVYRSEVGIVNSGTRAVRQIEISLEMVGPGTLVAASVSSVSFDYSSEVIEVSAVSDRTAEVLCQYLNAGDVLVVGLLFSDKPERVEARFRQPDTKCIVRTETVPEVPGIFIDAFFAALSSTYFLHGITRLLIPEYRRYLRARSKPRE